ncbi:hypothetical protein PC41400_20285 [Paenibacillus chitinolyticus]|uniref:Uncharacterized protein n=1 Tax=Paenibacillus chitinolyticus TaxID=79263 RepID=A0A410WZX2_9BACL|nr:hypothetical protein PC41400_20285 [Paenibacillus chitinolyticus]
MKRFESSTNRRQADIESRPAWQEILRAFRRKDVTANALVAALRAREYLKTGSARQSPVFSFFLTGGMQGIGCRKGK